MIPKVNLGVGEMGFMFCDVYLSLKNPSPSDIVSMNLPCLTSVLPGDTSDLFQVLVLDIIKEVETSAKCR